MYQLWTVINPDLKEGLEGCPVLSFDLFSPLCAQISPHLNRSLKQVVNQHLHQTCMSNIKLSFLHVPTMNYYQLWPERRVRRVSCPQFWPFFTTVRPNLPTSELKSPASCQPTSAWKQCCQCQIVFSASTLTWKKGSVRRVSCPQFWHFFTTVCPDFTASELPSAVQSLSPLEFFCGMHTVSHMQSLISLNHCLV